METANQSGQGCKAIHQGCVTAQSWLRFQTISVKQFWLSLLQRDLICWLLLDFHDLVSV